jgi:hypothetical protein
MRKQQRKKRKTSHSLSNAEWRKAHRAYLVEKTQKWRRQNPEDYVEGYKNYYKMNRELCICASTKWNEEHAQQRKEYMVEYMKDYNKGIRRRNAKSKRDEHTHTGA